MARQPPRHRHWRTRLQVEMVQGADQGWLEEVPAAGVGKVRPRPTPGALSERALVWQELVHKLDSNT